MKKFVLALTAALSLSGAALAQPLHLQPGSALIYPLFDSQPKSATVINVTNLSEDRADCGNGFRAGDVLAHYVYYGQEADGSSVCLEFDRFEPLTPADTVSVIASDHNPEMEVGYLVVTANDPESGDLIDFDFLIGSAFVANSTVDIMWSYTPYAFEAEGFDPGVSQDNCGRDIVATAGSPLVFDNNPGGYARFPSMLFIDSFFQQVEGVFVSQLTLMSTSGQDYVNELDVFTFNNQEDKFSRTFKFVCHTTVPLSDITRVTDNLGGDPDEFLVETGWMKLQGRNVLDLAGQDAGLGQPAILGVLVQICTLPFTAGHALHHTGSIDSTSIPVQP